MKTTNSAVTVTSSMSSRPAAQLNDGGLRIIGAGFGRTGTASMREALEILGYGPCYHMREVGRDDKKVKMWDGIGLGEAPEWNCVFENYQSTIDFPAAGYWEELMQYYPDAKVILTIRDPEKWWMSFYDTICPGSWAWSFLLQLTLVSNIQFRRMCRNCIWIPLFGSVASARDPRKAMQVFQQHNGRVQQTVPKERLLVMNVKEGWEPLCRFLHCSIPDVPFPNVNDSAQFQKMVAERKRKAIGRFFGAAVAAISIGYVLSRRR